MTIFFSECPLSGWFRDVYKSFSLYSSGTVTVNSFAVKTAICPDITNR